MFLQSEGNEVLHLKHDGQKNPDSNKFILAQSHATLLLVNTCIVMWSSHTVIFFRTHHIQSAINFFRKEETHDQTSIHSNYKWF